MNYKVMLLNETLEGVDREAATVALARAFKVSEDQIRSILQANSFVVKKNIDSGLAEQYKKHIEKIGFRATVEAMNSDGSSNTQSRSTGPENQAQLSSEYQELLNRVVQAKKARMKIRLISFSVLFVPAFLLIVGHEKFMVTLVGSTIVGLLGYVIGEVVRHFSADQRGLPRLEADLKVMEFNNSMAPGKPVGSSSQAATAQDYPKTDTSSIGQAESLSQINTISSSESEGVSIVDILRGGVVLFFVVAIGFWYYRSFHPTLKYPVYNCEAPEITSCKVDKSKVDCVLKNTLKVTANTNRYRVWTYGEDGILKDTTSLLNGYQVPPGRSVHIQFFDSYNISKAVICSLDPESPFAKMGMKKVD